MMTLLSFAIGNPLGRMLAKVAIVVALVGIAILMIYKKGRSDQKLSRTMATLEAMKDRINVDNEIRSMGIDARRDALKRWVR